LIFQPDIAQNYRLATAKSTRESLSSFVRQAPASCHHPTISPGLVAPVTMETTLADADVHR
jgi:hypothetical protein